MNKTDKPLARFKQNNKKEQAQMINIRHDEYQKLKEDHHY